MNRPGIILTCALLLYSCDSDPADTDAGTDAGSAMVDAGSDDDAGTGDDAGTTVDAGPGSDTWSSFALGFLTTYCNECHNGGPRDYRTIDDVRRDVSGITCGVSTVVESGCGSFPPPRQFPIGSGPFPSDAERTRFIDWLNAGLPE